MNLPDNFGWKYVYELPFFLLKTQCFSLLLLLLLLLVRLHDQSNSSDKVGGLLQVLQAPI